MKDKLKTLKDIEKEFENYSEDIGFVFFKLKAEAVKWVKRNRLEDIKQGRQTGNHFESHIYFTGAELWIKHFFNLTEEELKE